MQTTAKMYVIKKHHQCPFLDSTWVKIVSETGSYFTLNHSGVSDDVIEACEDKAERKLETTRTPAGKRKI